MDAIVAQLEVERAAQAGTLAEPLQKDHMQILAGLNPASGPLSAHSIRVFPPSRGVVGGDITVSYEGTLYFTVQVTIGALSEGDALLLLADAVGLVMDGIIRDHQLGETVEGPTPDAFEFGEIIPQGKGCVQNIVLAFIVRSGP